MCDKMQAESTESKSRGMYTTEWQCLLSKVIFETYRMVIRHKGGVHTLHHAKEVRLPKVESIHQ